MKKGIEHLIQCNDETTEKPVACWNWIDGGVVVKFGVAGEESEICRFKTPYPSRDGLRVIDAIGKETEFLCQVSDHGCGRKSVQVFGESGLIADCSVGEC